MLWALWLHCNEVIFQGRTASVDGVVSTWRVLCHGGLDGHECAKEIPVCSLCMLGDTLIFINQMKKILFYATQKNKKNIDKHLFLL